MREFFGFGGYRRTPEGYLSWQHLLFASILMLIMFSSAWLLGRRNKHFEPKIKNRVMIWAAVLIDSIELFKIVLICVRSNDPWNWLHNLPLFLCSIQLIVIPMAAFCKGRLRDAALDFVLIFGILGAVLGVYFAGQNYSAYPVICFDNVVSGITHSMSGFCSLYIIFSDMTSMKRSDIGICFGILSGFCILAYAANHLVNYNYMFLMSGDGTPYDILYNILGGDPILYPIGVVALFFAYITLFYQLYYLASYKKTKANRQPLSERY